MLKILISIFLQANLLCDAKYLISDELQQIDPYTSADWIDVLSNQRLPLCQKNANSLCIGTQQSQSFIHWEKTYNVPSSSRVGIYLEYQVSGNWNDQEFNVFANEKILVYTTTITLSDTNKLCDEDFLYTDFMYFELVAQIDTLKLTVRADGVDLGLYIQNIVIDQRTQAGSDFKIPFLDFVPTCQGGLEFVQYYCKCPPHLVFFKNGCQNSCDTNYLYLATTNECEYKQNCASCDGIQQELICDPGYYKIDTECVQKCPNDYYQSESMQCLDLSDYLSINENNNYPIDHYYFYKDTANFLHFFQNIDVQAFVSSLPKLTKERPFIYWNNRFVAGTLEKFQTQNLTLTTFVLNSQHEVRFRATGHFIDFYPSRHDVYINKLLYQDMNLIPSLNNEGGSQQDYICYYDLSWNTPRALIRYYNNIQIQVDQPLQDGKYEGLFYVDDIHIYQYRCQTNCDACLDKDTCSLCTHPANKDETCKCDSGYYLVNDVCITCPTYCVSCQTENVCDSCVPQSLRINAPKCDTCPSQYYLKPNVDNCQPCITGCNKCKGSDTCIACLQGYFLHQNDNCVLQCDNGYFNDNNDPLNPTCTLCSNNCVTCKDQANKCLSCQPDNKLENNVCYLCVDGTYLKDNSCLPCKTNCRLCKSPICLDCSDSYFMQIATNTCVGLCNSNQYPNMTSKTCDSCHNLCLTCVGPTTTDCLTCSKGLVLNLLNQISGQCLQKCNPGYFVFESVCAKCWIGCETCVDYSQVCLICASNYFRLNSNQYCYSQCPDGYFNNVNGYSCSLCDLNCLTCDGNSSQNCTSCTLPAALFEKQCLSECPIGYGNINAVCQPCSQNCDECFGTNYNQCTNCSSGYYFLHNACYRQCPTYYVGVRPQYICKCIFENCVICTDNQFNFNNVCYDQCPKGTYGYNGLCIKCHINCLTCFGEDDNQCISCTFPLTLYQNNCITQCPISTYQNQNNECVYCDSSCLACIGPGINGCSACYDQYVLNLDKSCQLQCTTQSYVVISERKCYPCDSSCKTCFGSQKNNCLTCNNFFYLNQCIDSCPDGFSISPNQTSCDPNVEIIPAQCSPECSSCKLTARYCTACAANRVPNPPFCNCEAGYFDKGGVCSQCSNKCSACANYADGCVLCKGDRQLPDCTCPLYYYDDGISVKCQLCPDNCATCNKTGCLTCLHDRISLPDCICPGGYYESHQPFCSICSGKCSICIGSQNFCLACGLGRVEPPVCNCPIGYFSNSDQECQKCNPICDECYEKGCLTCAANRKGPDNGICWCITPGVSRLNVGSLYCTDCELGVPFFGLNEDFTGFTIDFGASVTLTSQLDACSVIFEPETLLLLGDAPTCSNDLSVLFGENPTIKVGDDIKLKLTFQLNGCDQPFNEIQIKKLSFIEDADSHKPLVTFNDLRNKNICYPIQIQFLQKKYNGGQKFNVIKWEVLQPPDANPQIQQILNDAKNSEQITFPKMVFSADIYYKFQVTLESFAKLQNTIQVQLTPILRSTVFFEIQQDRNQFYRFEQITLPFTISYYNCIEKIPPPQILYYAIKFQNDVFVKNNITDNLIDGFTLNFSITIDPYYFNFTNPHTLIFTTTLVRSDYEEATQNSFDIYIIQSVPNLTIQGSSRMIGYEEELKLNAIINDNDYSSAEEISYLCIWECVDITTGTNCRNAFGQIIFDNNCNQIMKPKTFAPYKVFQFQVSIWKSQLLFSTNVSISTMEINLPILEVSDVNVNQLYNYYDEFILQISYPGINPDILMYAGAVVYNQIVVSTFQFYYLNVKFKLQDYFTNLSLINSNEIRLRLSVYDPHFIMPSVKSILLPMNIPPQNCELQYDKSIQIEFLDRLNINVSNCQDSDSPLTYSVYLYANSTIYQYDLIRARFYHNLLLIPPSKKQSFNIYLPYYNAEPNLLVVEIKDNIGGISNITTTIPVRQYKEINEETFVNYLNTQNGLDQQLLAYRVVVERLSILDGLLDYKEKLFKQLIQLDQNQSYLSNQTECIYHSISIIVGQNCLLLQFNQTDFLKQLNYRINQTAQELIHLSNLQLSNQLTSELNIQKNNYIQQYSSFANILSQFVKFRVSINTTATEIQSSLNVIMDYLQSISIPNEPLFTIQSNSANMNFGYLTSKMVQSVTSTSLKSEEDQSSNNSTSTNFYKFSQTRFIDNPFYATKGFPKNSSGYQAVDPKIQSTSSNITKNSLSSPISFSFPSIKKLAPNTTQQCIGQVNSEEWSADVCKSVKKDGQVICQCETLNPTSIMESLDYIMDKAEQVFSMDTLAAFLTFPFYKAVIFYFYLTITIGYLYIIYWGLKADNLMFQNLQNQQELEDKKKLAEEQLQQQQQKSNENNDDIPIIEPYQVIFKNKIYVEEQFQVENSSKGQEVKEIDIVPKDNQQESPEQLDNLNQFSSNRKIKLPQHQKSVTLVFPQFLKYFHQILSIIYKDDAKKPRGLRATIIYTSIMGSLVVLFLFNQPGNLSLTMALALLTAPLNKIYQILLEKLLSHKKKTVRIIGAILMIIVAALISYTMLAGLVLSGSVDTSNRWSYIFISSLALDNIVYSPLQLVIQYNIHIGRIKIQILQSILYKLLDEEARKYIEDLIEQVE